MENLKNVLFVFPVMLYYLLEAVIVGVFITIIWNLVLSNALGNITYLQWVGIYWIVKMLLFDVFKLVTSLTSAGNNMQEKIEENPQDYNKQFEE